MDKKGFTILEAFISSVVMVILIGVITAAVSQMRSLFYTTDIMSRLQADGRVAASLIAQDLRNVNGTSTTINQDDPFSGTDNLTYYLPSYSNSTGTVSWGSNITIALDSGGTNSLLKTDGSNTTVLANSVESINFLKPSSNRLEVTLELEKTASDQKVYNTDITSVINMRN